MSDSTPDGTPGRLPDGSGPNAEGTSSAGPSEEHPADTTPATSGSDAAAAPGGATAAGGRRGLPPVAVFIGTAVLAGAIVALGVALTGDPDAPPMTAGTPTATVSPTEPTEPATPTPTEEPTASPTPDATGTPTEEPAPREVPAPEPGAVPPFGDLPTEERELEETAEVAPSVETRLLDLELVTPEGSGVGQVQRDAVLVTVEVVNESGEAVDLSTATVTAYVGEDGVPTGPVDGDDRVEPLSGRLAAGDTVEGRYIFTLPPGEHEGITVAVMLDLESPVVLFQGDLPTNG